MHTLCMLKSECDLSTKEPEDGILVGVCSSSIGSTISGGVPAGSKGKTGEALGTVVIRVHLLFTGGGRLNFSRHNI